MSRLFDAIPELNSRVVPAICVDISNVAAYYATTEKPEWDYFNDFPNVAPPFPHAFFEMRDPPFKKIDGKMIANPNPVSQRMGLLVRSLEIEAPEFPDQVKLVRAMLHKNPSIVDEQIDGAKWLCMVQCLSRITETGEIVMPFFCAYGVDEMGKIHRSPNGFRCFVDDNYLRRIEIFVAPSFVSQRDDGFIAGAITGEVLHPYLLALSFMHCKNVNRVEHPIPPKINTRRAKDGKPPLTKYYTLEIEAMKRTLQSEGGISTNGLKRALHICRGHFATYTLDKPLFGHYVGTVWKPQHVKGSKAAGEVVKDYAMKAPRLPE